MVNKVTCRENKVGEKGGKGFGCPSKKEEECMLLFGGGQPAAGVVCVRKLTHKHMLYLKIEAW